MFIEWVQRYSVGVPSLDEEHKQLIAVMNQLREQSDAGEDKSTLSRTLKQLDAVTRKHFADEEKFMASLPYPDLARHQAIHADLLGKLATHVGAFESGDGKLSGDFFAFLKTWLTGHLAGIDKRYAEHARGVGKGAGPG